MSSLPYDRDATPTIEADEATNRPVLRKMHCDCCGLVNDWPMIAERQERTASIEVYECPICGARQRYAV